MKLERMQATVAVYLVTYRRHELLRRSLASILAQTYTDFVVRVVNDDPTDGGVADIISAANDDRVRLFTPCQKRGATQNFNLPFQEQYASFVSLLEDDNWWEPTFLSTMMATLKLHPDLNIVLANEKIWAENEDGTWTDTGRMIWDFDDIRLHTIGIVEACGSARFINSGMLFRLTRGKSMLIPDRVPPDVSEHFRDRLLGPHILLNGTHLVNYADTIQTVRSKGSDLWGKYQAILIGSMFIALETAASREALARQLWTDCHHPTSPRATSLIVAGVAIKEARCLLTSAPWISLWRFCLWLARSPARWSKFANARQCLHHELNWLVNTPLTQALTRSERIAGRSERDQIN